MTSNLPGRPYQHRESSIPGFTSRYEAFHLVRFEMLGDMDAAISREKQLKRRHRQWKINLIEQDNPQSIDLARGLGFDPQPPRGHRNEP